MSKGLEALEALDYVRMCCSDGLQLPQNQSVEQVVLISDSLATIERELKALEIIKTKNVDISLIKNCYGAFAYAVYNSYIDKEKYAELTKEEFDLLKEVLENDK